MTDLSPLWAHSAKVSELALHVVVLRAGALLPPVPHDAGLVASLVLHAAGAHKGTLGVSALEVVPVVVLPVLVHVGEASGTTLALEHEAQVSLAAGAREVEIVLLLLRGVLPLFSHTDPVSFSLFG